MMPTPGRRAVASLLFVCACVGRKLDLGAPPGAPAPLLQGSESSGPSRATQSATPCPAFGKLEVGTAGLRVDGQNVAAPPGSNLGTGAAPSGPFYDRIKSCAPHSRDETPRAYGLTVAPAVPYDQAAAAIEMAAIGGFGLPTLETPTGALVLRVLPVGAKGMQVSLIDEVAEPSSPNTDPNPGSGKEDSEASFGEVRRPVQVVLLRIDGTHVEAVWADQLADEPIVKRVAGDLGKLDALAAQFKRACSTPSLTCDRILVEADHAVDFGRVAKAVAVFAAARTKREPLKTEFVQLDAGATAEERAAARIGVPLDSGKLSQDAVENVIRSNYGRINGCYKAGLDRNPALRGRVVVRFVVDLRGDAKDVADARDAREITDNPAVAKGEPSIIDAAVIGCILDVFKSMKFTAPQGGSVKIFYPLTFAPK